ncbi:MAG: hypothetical protein JWO04_3258 [Gammaproteobacteria bacterium]|nr:hypothetical protein [Gammaproteobacteria bacterium]
MKLISALQRICSTAGLTSHPFRRERAARVSAMSALEEQRAEWLGSHFWNRLDRLDGRHQRVQSEREAVRRNLERDTPREADELRCAWRRYCEVIAELEQTTAEFEAFRTFTE